MATSRKLGTRQLTALRAASNRGVVPYSAATPGVLRSLERRGLVEHQTGRRLLWWSLADRWVLTAEGLHVRSLLSLAGVLWMREPLATDHPAGSGAQIMHLAADVAALAVDLDSLGGSVDTS